jgi:hypothetical protein
MFLVQASPHIPAGNGTQGSVWPFMIIPIFDEVGKSPLGISSRQASGVKRKRGYLLTFRVQVKEDRIKDSFHTVSVTKDTHRPRSSSDL